MPAPVRRNDTGGGSGQSISYQEILRTAKPKPGKVDETVFTPVNPSTEFSNPVNSTGTTQGYDCDTAIMADFWRMLADSGITKVKQSPMALAEVKGNLTQGLKEIIAQMKTVPGLPAIQLGKFEDLLRKVTNLRV